MMSVMMFKALESKCSLAQPCATSFNSFVPLQFIMRACVMLKSLTRKDEQRSRNDSFIHYLSLFVAYLFMVASRVSTYLVLSNWGVALRSSDYSGITVKRAHTVR